MARAPLVLETHGKITRKRIAGTPTAFTRYRDADGVTRKVQRIGKTLAEAEENLKKALKQRHLEADASAVLSSESTIDNLVSEWLTESREAERYAAATLRTYSKRAEKTITPGIGSVRLREVTVSKLDRFVKLTIKHHGPGTARTVRSVLINAFDLATRHGLTDSNPARNTAPVPTTKSTPNVPDGELLARLMEHLKAYDEELEKKGRTAYLYDLTALYLATGARTAEMLATTWTSASDEEGGFKLSIEATLVIGEDGKLFRQTYTKTDSGMRRLTLPKHAADIMRRRRVESTNEIVFPSATGTYRWPHNLRRDWREALAGTEFEKITPTSFRKAVATLLRDELGMSAASGQLGHSDERVTKKHYAKRVVDAPDVSEALQKFFQNAE